MTGSDSVRKGSSSGGTPWRTGPDRRMKPDGLVWWVSLELEGELSGCKPSSSRAVVLLWPVWSTVSAGRHSPQPSPGPPGYCEERSAAFKELLDRMDLKHWKVLCTWPQLIPGQMLNSPVVWSQSCSDPAEWGGDLPWSTGSEHYPPDTNTHTSERTRALSHTCGLQFGGSAEHRWMCAVSPDAPGTPAPAGYSNAALWWSYCCSTAPEGASLSSHEHKTLSSPQKDSSSNHHFTSPGRISVCGQLSLSLTCRQTWLCFSLGDNTCTLTPLVVNMNITRNKVMLKIVFQPKKPLKLYWSKERELFRLDSLPPLSIMGYQLLNKNKFKLISRNQGLWQAPCKSEHSSDRQNSWNPHIRGVWP